MLRTLIVEDEPMSSLYLSNLLSEAVPGVQIIGTTATEDEAVSAINTLHPNLVFLDIELRTGSGFGVINRIGADNAHVIFTTALDHQATALLRISGVPYIQKPIDLDSLSLAVLASRTQHTSKHYKDALCRLRETLHNDGTPLTILIENGEGSFYVPLQDIVTLETLEKGSLLRLKTGEEMTAGYELKELDGLLKGFGFFRTHIRYMVNRVHVHRLNASDSLVMEGEFEVPVSPKRLAELKAYLAL